MLGRTLNVARRATFNKNVFRVQPRLFSTEAATEAVAEVAPVEVEAEGATAVVNAQGVPARLLTASTFAVYPVVLTGLSLFAAAVWGNFTCDLYYPDGAAELLEEVAAGKRHPLPNFTVIRD